MPNSKVVSVLGSTSVGKSALTLQFIDNRFVENYDPTIAKSYNKNHFRLNNQEYNLTVNDTAGLEEQSQIQTMYINSDGFILVYSITDMQSFQIVQTIYNKLCDEYNGGIKPVVLIGNKSDLKEQRRVSYENGKKLAESWGASFLETSAKDLNLVVQAFQTLLKQIDPTLGTNVNNINGNNSTHATTNTTSNIPAAATSNGGLTNKARANNENKNQQQQQKCIIS